SDISYLFRYRPRGKETKSRRGQDPEERREGIKRTESHLQGTAFGCKNVRATHEILHPAWRCIAPPSDKSPSGINTSSYVALSGVRLISPSPSSVETAASSSALAEARSPQVHRRSNMRDVSGTHRQNW